MQGSDRIHPRLNEGDGRLDVVPEMTGGKNRNGK